MIDVLGVHPSVAAVFPPARLADHLADRDVTVRTTERPDDCDALVTFDFEPAFLGADLQWIHSVQAGVDAFPQADLEAAGVALTNSAGIHGDTVGETVLGYMLTFARRLHDYRDAQRERRWDRPAWDRPFSLAGERLCVVGLGTIGQSVAARADALEMDVVGVKRTPVPVDHVRRVYGPDDHRAAIADARFVVLAVPLTPSTEGLIGSAELAAMADDGYLVNVARGAVVDQDALVEAIETETIAGAALDVFETEPLPADSPLWDAEDVLVTPHAAGATDAYCSRVARLVDENLDRFAADEALCNRVV